MPDADLYYPNIWFEHIVTTLKWEEMGIRKILFPRPLHCAVVVWQTGPT